MEEDIRKVLEVLRLGGIILYPTDTIWGIGCDATNSQAVSKIFRLKKRKDSKSMLVLVDEAGRLNQYVREIPEICYEINDVSDKPVTIIYPGARNLAHELIAEDGSAGIRITRDEFCKKLISRFKKPIVSTSANISDNPPPASFNDIDEAIINGVDYAVLWRRNDKTKAKPSSIIKVGLRGEIEIIRK